MEGLEELRRVLNPVLIRKAAPRAINKAAQLGRTAESKAVRVVYAITAKRLNLDLEKVSGKNRATASKPRAVIRAVKRTKRNPGLQHFGARQVRKGVSYRIRKDGGRKTLAHAFKSVMPRGGEGAFIRKGKQRLPIVRKVGPSVVQMVERVGVGPIKLAVANNLFRLFKHEYEREVARVRR